MARNKYQASAGTKLFYGDEPGTLNTTNLDTAATNPISAVKRYGKLPDNPITTFDTTRTDQVDSLGAQSWREEFGLGFETAGMLEFDLGADDAELQLVYSLKTARAFLAFKVAFSGGARLVMLGAIINIAPTQDEKGETLYTVSIKFSYVDFIPASATVLLQSVTVTGAKSLTLSFSGVVNATTFTAGNILVIHGGTAVPATSVAAGLATDQLVITAAGFQANPAGDTLLLAVAPTGVRYPVSKVAVAA